MLKKNLVNISIAIVGLIVAAISFTSILNSNLSLDSASAAVGIGLGLAVVGITNFFNKTDLCKTAENGNLSIQYKAQSKANNITKWSILGAALLTVFAKLPMWLTLLLLVIHLFNTFIQIYVVSKYSTTERLSPKKNK